MKPSDIGLPPQFDAWRPGQLEVVTYAATSDKRHIGLDAPPGSGKTLEYLGAALLRGARVVVVTGTKSLQDQLTREFGAVGVDLRGMSNYECLALSPIGNFPADYLKWRTMHPWPGAWPGCDLGPCRAGYKCSLRQGGCRFFDQQGLAQGSRIVWTNYACWFQQSQALLPRDMVVFDEAHEAADILLRHLRVEISDQLLYDLDLEACPEGGNDGIDQDPGKKMVWEGWLSESLSSLEARLEVLERDEFGRSSEGILLKDTRDKFARLQALGGEWVYEQIDGTGDRYHCWEPVWPGPYVEQYLSKGISKVMWVSATLGGQRTLDLLNIPQGECLYIRQASSFAPERRPIIRVPCVKVRFNWSDSERRQWLELIDDLMRPRYLRWKGIVHTSSYRFAEDIASNSRYAGNLMTHSNARELKQLLPAWEASPPPGVIVSPTLGTGYDGKGDKARWQIVTKIKFRDMRGALGDARRKQDRGYSNYTAAMDLMQVVGRVMREGDDWGETLIIDDQAEWFIKRMYREGVIAQWFMDAYREEAFPRPLGEIIEGIS